MAQGDHLEEICKRTVLTAPLMIEMMRLERQFVALHFSMSSCRFIAIPGEGVALQDECVIFHG
jgi:hypothetical protein